MAPEAFSSGGSIPGDTLTKTLFTKIAVINGKNLVSNAIKERPINNSQFSSVEIRSASRCDLVAKWSKSAFTTSNEISRNQ